MADIGRDARALVIQAREMNVKLGEMRLAQERAKIARLRAEAQIEECNYNIEQQQKAIDDLLVNTEATIQAARDAGGDI